jgi:hypothetical protein
MLRLLALLGLTELLRDEQGKALLRTVGILVGLLLAFLVFTWFTGNLAQIGAHSTAIAAVYVVGFVLICGIAYLVVRPKRAALRTPPEVDTKAIREHVSHKAQEIGQKLDSEFVRRVAPGQVFVLGLPYVGKRSLRSLLAARLPETEVIVHGDTSVDPELNAALASGLPDGATVIYLVTQDFYSYEQQLLKAICAKPGVRLSVVLNKIDLLSRAARADILASLSRKREQLQASAHVAPILLSVCAAAPIPELHALEQANGEVIEREVPSKPQIDAVLDQFFVGERA